MNQSDRIQGRGRRLPLLRAAFLLICSLIAAETAYAADKTAPPQKLQVAGLEVAVWLPSDATSGPWPIIIFSHGFHGCDTQSSFLMEALAKAGYAVFAPNHHDAACRRLRAWLTRPDVPFRNPQASPFPPTPAPSFCGRRWAVSPCR
jgi:predicted dienelactone hydrolase